MKSASARTAMHLAIIALVVFIFVLANQAGQLGDVLLTENLRVPWWLDPLKLWPLALISLGVSLVDGGMRRR